MLEVLANVIKQEREKRHTDWEEIKLFLFLNDMTTYVENPKQSKPQKTKTSWY